MNDDDDMEDDDDVDSEMNNDVDKGDDMDDDIDDDTRSKFPVVLSNIKRISISISRTQCTFNLQNTI